jgi:hypothetical protein
MLKSKQPYQPYLLRILHGLTGIFLILAILSAFWTYNTYDGRWGTIPLPDYRQIEGIHGTFGLYTLLIFPAFVRYAFAKGQRRLVQRDSLAKLSQLDRPVGWYALNRLVNTLSLFALTFALFSGKMMDETWLPKRELHHLWYSLHLVSWGVMVGAIALHVLINAKVGGTPLLLSMWDKNFRAKDSPQRWPVQVVAWWHKVRQSAGFEWLRSLASLTRLELIIWVALIAAWAISLLKEYVLKS